MEISFIQMQIWVYLHVNKTNFHLKGFTLGLVLKERRKATQKWPIHTTCFFVQTLMRKFKLICVGIEWVPVVRCRGRDRLLPFSCEQKKPSYFLLKASRDTCL